jgi:hypothetical protein
MSLIKLAFICGTMVEQLGEQQRQELAALFANRTAAKTR